MRVNLQPAYVIHSRPYLDSSALLDVFTAEYGRIPLVARGARRQTRKGGAAALLQPFTPLLLSFSGRLQLKTLVAAEAARGVLHLRGERLFSGLYLNELLVRLLHRNDAHPALFAAYDSAVHALSGSATVDSVLRRFELTLLGELGYGFDPGIEGETGHPVHANGRYRYLAGVGLIAGDPAGLGAGDYCGADLMAIAAGDFSGSARQAAKRLLREALAVHLGAEPLRSRALFRTAGSNSAAGSARDTSGEQA